MKKRKTLKHQEEYTDHVDISKLIILTIMTGGLYIIWWIVKNWMDLKKNTNEDIWFMNYVGLLIPFYNIYVIYDQFESIKKVANKKSIDTNWSAGWFVFFLLLGGAMRSAYGSNLVILMISFAISLFVMVTVQDTLNELWDKTQKKLKKRDFFEFRINEIIWLIVGTLTIIGYLSA